jgi:hypothetical protein
MTMGVLTARTPDRGPDPQGTALKLHAEALFASNLQASDRPSAEQIGEAVATTLQRLGTAGCAARLAGEFGDHPELAATRMTWALATIRGNHLTADPTFTPARRTLVLAG